MISIKALSKSYGSKKVLYDINLEYAPGYVYGVVGPNGAGKTTLFRCIAGLEDFQGEVSSTFHPLKNHLGFLLTDPFFFPRMTGAEYIQLHCQARGVEIADPVRMNVFELPLQEYAITYSIGMKKKLAITAILSQGNSCYIFDEPFNGMDLQGVFLLTGIIHKLKSLGKTVIVSSHILSTVTEVCDQIDLLEDGRHSRRIAKQDFGKLIEELRSTLTGDSIDRLELK